jgi:F0F1-type ATP synthase assembly protein I
MLPKSSDNRLVQRSMTVAAIGAEMVVPTVIGWWLDDRLGWTPWATLIGATLGFAGAIAHMLRLAALADADKDSPSTPKTDAP